MQHTLLQSSIPVPEWWQTEPNEIEAILNGVTAGELKQLSVSPGGKPVHAAIYGPAEPHLKGTANFNSALGAKNPASYYDKSARNHPVLCIVGGIHGHEVEGIAASLSIIRLLETGLDLTGTARPSLTDKLKKLRLIVVPLANPDGRARVPYRGWCGLPQDEMTKWGQGTRKDGSLYRWRFCKEVHPMVGDVDLLGGYFDNNGVNMMHDDWANPMSLTTKALLQLVAEEGPDCLINLHSYSSAPGVLPTTYIPGSQQKKINMFAEQLYERLTQRGHQHAKLPKDTTGPLSGEGNDAPPLNLQSMFYHVGADLPILFESPHGVVSPTAAKFNYEEILDVHHQLFETAADEILSK